MLAPGPSGSRPSSGPIVRVSVVVWRDGQVLMGRRLGPIEPGTWSLPGGKLEPGEGIEECARRELFEECGVEVAELTQLGFSDYRRDGHHFVTLFLCGHWLKGEPELKEPDHFDEWRLVDWERPPEPVFPAVLDFRRRLGYDLGQDLNQDLNQDAETSESEAGAGR